MMGTAGPSRIIVKRHGNAMAVAAGVLSLVGVAFGLVAILAVPALCLPRGTARD
jgi:hypothetical protein